ncbi:MAG: hypothetical protein Q4E65_08230 [Clostridia bacterium]|nr:hypothetical protein [Clostridia bacterium]
MRRVLAVFIAAMLLLCGGCKNGGTAAPSPQAPSAPYVIALPAPLTWQLREDAAYYPQGSDPTNADYVFTCAYPVFSGDFAETANEAIARAIEEYRIAVIEERLPYADRAAQAQAPYTHVTATVAQQDGYTNVCFADESGFGEEAPAHAARTVVLDAKGMETDLYVLSGLYTPEALIAQQIYNQIDAADPQRARYHGDLTIEDIQLTLDLYNGFTVVADGFELILPCGAVEDEAYGISRFTISWASLYPDFVGERMAAADYRALLPTLHTLARACGAENHSFDGVPDALVATLFMGLLYQDRAENGMIIVPQAEYEALAKRYFTDLPAELAGGDGMVLQDGAYRIPVTAIAEYGLRVDDCVPDGEDLRLRCVLLYGLPGSANWGELEPVSVKLQKAADGYLFTGFLFS